MVEQLNDLKRRVFILSKYSCRFSYSPLACVLYYNLIISTHGLALNIFPLARQDIKPF